MPWEKFSFLMTNTGRFYKNLAHEITQAVKFIWVQEGHFEQ